MKYTWMVGLLMLGLVVSGGETSAPNTLPLDVRALGAKGDNVADDTAALQQAIDRAGTGETLFFPLGTYKVTASLQLGSKKVRLLGASPNSNGSKIVGSVNGPIITHAPGTGSDRGASIEGLYIQNTHATGMGIRYENATMQAIRDVGISAYIGIYFEINMFTILIEQVRLNGPAGHPAGSIGILAGGHTEIISTDIVGFEHGIRAFRTTVNVTGCRFEVNKVGLVLGMDQTGASSALQRSAIVGNSFEANDTAVLAFNVVNTFIGGLGLQGSTNAPSGQSQLGLDIRNTTDVTWQNVLAGGAHREASIKISGTQVRSRMTQAHATNGYVGPPAGKTWDVKTPLAGIEFEQTSYPLRGDGIVTPSVEERVVARSLSAVDYLNGMPLGRNMRGKAVPVGSGVTTLAVAFPVALGAGTAAINTATAQTGGGTLAPGTYFYIGSTVNEAGESAVTSEKTVTVTAPNNQVAFTFFGGGTTPVSKRRIYRGTATGVYDGFFETGVNASSFTDTGQAFTGLKTPMQSGVDAETSMQEPDTNYAVIVTPAWNTTVWVTNKATSGFTVNFGTAPGSNSTLDWFIVR